MNRFALVGAALAVVVCAAVAMAASPLPAASAAASAAAPPMASPMASPYASTAPSTSPSASPSASPTASPKANSGSNNQNTAAAQPETWTSDVNPVNIEGTATMTKNSDGTGMLVLQLTGVVNATHWTVDVEPGAVQHPNDANITAFKQGTDVKKIAPDKIQVQLTTSEMQDFDHALANNPGGVTIFVSDGHRLSAATLTSAQ